MSTMDIVILVILALFVWKGVKLGLIESVGGIIGLFVGAYLAGQYYQEAGEMIKGLLFGSAILANVIGFILVFIVVNRAVALLFWIIDKIFHIIAVIPFLKSFNRLLGGLLGLVEGFIFIGIIVYFLSLVPFTGGLQDSVSESRFSPIMETVGKIADPFIPDNIISLPFNLDGLDINSSMLDAESLKNLNLPEGLDINDIINNLTSEQLQQLQEQYAN